jgi:hypothetical protein
MQWWYYYTLYIYIYIYIIYNTYIYILYIIHYIYIIYNIHIYYTLYTHIFMLYIHSSFFLMVIPFIHGSDQKLPAARSPLSRTAAWTTEMSSSGVVNVSCRVVVSGEMDQSWDPKWVTFLWLPSGKLTVCYWKWPFIVDFPIKNGDFP